MLFLEVLVRNLVALISLLLLTFLILANTILDRKVNKYLLQSVFLVFVIIITDMLDGYFESCGATFQNAYIARKICLAIFYSCIPFSIISLSRIYKNNKKVVISFKIISFVFVLINIISIFYPLTFEVDKNAQLIRGHFLYYVFFIFVFSLFLYYAFSSFSKYNGFRKFDFVFTIFFSVVIFIMFLIEVLFSIRFLVWNMVAGGLGLYYCAIIIQGYRFDSLTNIYNRETFKRDVEHIENNVSCYVVMFDLNDLKKVNDQQGHDAGDKLIARSANYIRRFFSKYGSVYRYGGDEFVGIITKIDNIEIISFVENLRNWMKKNDISISVGYSFYNSMGAFCNALEEADSNMYYEKSKFHKNTNL